MAIIAVSDVHLGYMDKDGKHSLSDKESFMIFLDKVVDKDDITDFFIVGDFLDMWRRDAVGVTIENRDVLDRLSELGRKMRIHYMAGNHDYRVCDLKMYHYPFSISECKDPKLGFPIDQGNPPTRYIFKHGYDFEPIMAACEPFFNLLCRTNDEVGGFESKLYDIISSLINHLGSKGIGDVDIMTYLEKIGAIHLAGNEDFGKYIAPLISRIYSSEVKIKSLPQKSFLNSSPEDRVRQNENTFRLKKPIPRDGQRTVLVFGHTHTPFHYIDEKNHNDIINLGSWVTTYDVHNTYLEIRDGKETLKIYPSGVFSPRYTLPDEFKWKA